jgi:uncharacterized protein DUF2694
LSDADALPLSDQSFIASTPDDLVFVRVAVRGHVLGVQLEPGVMARPGSEIAERVVACADVAYLQGQVALRSVWEEAGLDSVCVEDMPTEDDLTAARERLESL